jgi:NAD-dependent dihydropyrimidine dehydrogenase PreA subunit
LIIINSSRCDGCGECVEACPAGAIYLVGGKAAVEPLLCRDCSACISACPTEALSIALPSESGVEPPPVPALRPEPQVIQVKTHPAHAPLRSGLLPVVGGALAWAGRELLPRLADYFLQDFDRRLERRQTSAAQQVTPFSRSPDSGRGTGRRRRRRRGGC